ncbi:MAG TPA: hypothetical protein PK668_04995 [Myxococcota bacterium]|nr:hypothetical protein [Myxococcota bacterium]HRY92214.1 hypothetical protein [Myxococcota bacterium]
MGKVNLTVRVPWSHTPIQEDLDEDLALQPVQAAGKSIGASVRYWMLRPDSPTLGSLIEHLAGTGDESFAAALLASVWQPGRGTVGRGQRIQAYQRFEWKSFRKLGDLREALRLDRECLDSIIRRDEEAHVGLEKKLQTQMAFRDDTIRRAAEQAFAPRVGADKTRFKANKAIYHELLNEAVQQHNAYAQAHPDLNPWTASHQAEKDYHRALRTGLARSARRKKWDERQTNAALLRALGVGSQVGPRAAKYVWAALKLSVAPPPTRAEQKLFFLMYVRTYTLACGVVLRPFARDPVLESLFRAVSRSLMGKMLTVFTQRKGTYPDDWRSDVRRHICAYLRLYSIYLDHIREFERLRKKQIPVIDVDVDLSILNRSRKATTTQEY